MHQVIKIKDILQSSRLSLFNFDKNIPLEKWLNCPSCGTNLKPVCVLTNGSDQRIRYGLCETCGYMGYTGLHKLTCPMRLKAVLKKLLR